MRHLAKVKKTSFLDGAELHLLAREIDAQMWEILSDGRVITTSEGIPYQEGVLVLVEVSGNQEVTAVDDATPWVLSLIEGYLARGITPEFLEQEIERAEQWRQSLTLQSQEVGRRALETAARRDEIQELERNLELERQNLERREAELQARADLFNQQIQQYQQQYQQIQQQEL